MQLRMRPSLLVRRFRRTTLSRKGIITVLAAACLVVLFAFVALAVDTGMIVLTHTRMQNGVDAASLAASQELTGAGDESGKEAGTTVAKARQMAADVAAANGIYVDPDKDVTFGKRSYDAASGDWPINWGQTPYNVVKVIARRDQQDLSAPDGRFKLSFGWAVGKPSVEMRVSANAYVEARDIVVVLDFSSSMNDDSQMPAFGKLGQANVEANLDAIWQSLVTSNAAWPGTTKLKFPATGFGSINSALGTLNSNSDENKVYKALGLDQTESGKPRYPFPQAGKSSSGTPNAMPSTSASQEMWLEYIRYTQAKSGTYSKRYGYRTLMDFLLTQKFRNSQSEDLWRTPHYPFHAMKNGVSLFCQMLEDLNVGDQLGLVTYDTAARAESKLVEDGYNINLGSDLITDDYDAINAIQRHKQAGHYNSNTGMGYGIKESRLLLQNYARAGARPTMLVITDGQTNIKPSGWTLPSGWSWNKMADFDGDGKSDYSTYDSYKQYAYWEASEAVKADITIHTMTVGAGADRPLMSAIAKAGGGIWIDVPGGSTIAEMQEQMLAAFAKIAAKVPSAKLVYAE